MTTWDVKINTKIRWYKYIVIHHTATEKCMSASEMQLSMQRTWINNKWATYIPTHMIIWCSGDIAYVNPRDRVVWATQNADANWNGIHIEVVWNFNVWKPTQAQYNTLKKLIADATAIHPWIIVKWHKDFQPHTCPWNNFDFKQIEPFIPLVHANWAKRPLPKITGNTVNERAKSFIRNYWYDYNEFVIKWLKPEVLICIARAEWFGKNSGSKNNIMNCGNNNRWDRVDFDNYWNSVDCAAHKLYAWLLRNKQTIGDLSYAGNGTIDMQYIYASNTWPREINIRNCLGIIYNKNITPDFLFRK